MKTGQEGEGAALSRGARSAGSTGLVAMRNQCRAEEMFSGLYVSTVNFTGTWIFADTGTPAFFAGLNFQLCTA